MAGKSGAIRAGRAFVEVFLDRSRLTRGLKSAQRQLRGFSAAAGGFGRQMIGFGAGAAAPLAMAATVFARFSDRMSEVRAVTGATESDFRQLESRAKELGRTTSWSASEVAEAMKFLGMAGFSTEQILAGIPGVLNLARAGAVDLGLAADIASDVGSAFGLAADDIGHLGDVLAATATSSNTSIEGLGESFKFAAPVAEAAGQSLEETAAALGLLGNNAVKASMAGTDVKNLLTIMAQTPDLGFGVKAADEAGNMRPLLDVMRDLGEATAGMRQADRLAFFMERFGKISGKSALILARAGDQVDVMRAQLAAADGTAAAVAGTMDDNLGGSFRMLMSAVEGVAIEIGDALAPMLREWADGLQAASGWIARTVKRSRVLVVAIAKTIAVGIGIGAVLVMAGGAAAAMASGIGVALGVLAAMKTVVLALASAVAFLASPIGIVVAGLGLLATWFATSTATGGAALDWLREKFRQLAGGAMEALGGIGDAMAAGDLQLAAAVLWSALRVAWHSGVADLNETWAAGRDFFLDIWSAATTSMAHLFLDTWAGLRSGWVETTAFLGAAWSRFTAGMLSAWRTTQHGLTKGVLQVMGLFDSELDVEGATQIVDEDYFNQRARAGGEAAAAHRQSEQQRKAELARIEAERQAASGELDRQADADRASRQAASESTAGQLQGKQQAAQTEYQAALAKAQAARAAAGAAAGDGAEGGTGSLAKKLRDAVAGLGAAGQGGTAVLGSFNAAAARGFGAGSGPEEQIADATEETAKNTAAIAKQLKKQHQAAFA